MIEMLSGQGHALSDLLAAAGLPRSTELFDEGYGRDIVAARLCMSASIVEKWLLTYRSVGSEVLLCMGSRKTR